MVHAILSAEDKRFFQHSGIDTLRLAKAIYVDLRERRKEQGASTLTMQLARNLCLRRDKSWKRKIEEALITIHLEHELSKDQIFERYCNIVYLGGDGAFGINGVGEAARAYFNKDVRALDLAESATIAGLIQRPVHLNPFRYPNRAVERRNFVLKRMRENKYISQEQSRKPLRRRSVCTPAQRSFPSRSTLSMPLPKWWRKDLENNLTSQAPSIQPWISAYSGRRS